MAGAAQRPLGPQRSREPPDDGPGPIRFRLGKADGPFSQEPVKHAATVITARTCPNGASDCGLGLA